ncbi:type II toxin-antitoxin system Phd/YefM family antitoxin [Brucella sp. IR073]|uniref:type II toxin-antitoxin system Phd/YefM family antitoxin n=1 Tax=unclassified Brucella TaxID=2632610 RepID=UPI003B980D43
MQVTVHAAKTNLSKLIEAAIAGEEVVIAKGKRPVAKIVAIPQTRFVIGILKDELEGTVPNFLAPMEEGELALWEGKE